MAEEFDPYHKWFGIPPKDQPPTHYRLLGVDPFESDRDVITSAADMRMSHVRNFQTGKRSDLAKKIRNEISAARLCLLDPEKKSQYDELLRHPIGTPTPPPLIPTPLIPTPTSEPVEPDQEPDPEPLAPPKPKTTLYQKWTWLVLLSRSVLIFIGRMFLVPPRLFDHGLRIASGKDHAILHVFLRCVTAIVILLGLATWWGWESGYLARPVSKRVPAPAEKTNQKTKTNPDKTEKTGKIKSDQSVNTSKTKSDNQKTNLSVATKTLPPIEKTDKLPGNGQATIPEKTGLNGKLPPVKTQPKLKTEKTPNNKQPVKPSPDIPDPVSEFIGHTDKVSSVAFSPDGLRFVSGSWDKTVKIWDAETGEELKEFVGHRKKVYCTAYSPNGKRIASGGSDRWIIVWDVKIEKEIKTLKGHNGTIYSVAFDRDSLRIVSGSADRTIKIWNIKTGKAINIPTAHKKVVNAVAFSPDGSQIASGSADTTVKIWNASTGDYIRTLNGHSNIVNSVAYSSDGNQIVSGSSDNTVIVWFAKTGTKMLTFKGHRSDVFSAAFSPKKSLIASGSKKTVKIWETRKGRIIKTLEGYTEGVTSLDFSPDGRRIVFGGADFAIRIWNLDANEKDL